MAQTQRLRGLPGSKALTLKLVVSKVLGLRVSDGLEVSRCQGVQA